MFVQPFIYSWMLFLKVRDKDFDDRRRRVDDGRLLREELCDCVRRVLELLLEAWEVHIHDPERGDCHAQAQALQGDQHTHQVHV